MYFAFIGCWFYDLRARPSRIPVSKFASGRCDRRPVIFSYRGLVCSFKTVKCSFDRGKTFSLLNSDAPTLVDPAGRQSPARLP
jgi:hypothetical protein